MKIERRFTTEETGAYGALAFRTTASDIRNPDGSVVFSLDGIEVPEGWSQVAADVLAQKYFRKAGVPAALRRVKEKGVPAFLWRSVADEAKLAAELGFAAEFLENVPLVNRPGVRFPEQGRFHPRKYLAGLAKAFTSLGGRIHEHSAAGKFSEDPRRVEANGKTVACEDVVIATHNPLVGYGGTTGAALFQTKLALYSSYVVAGAVAVVRTGTQMAHSAANAMADGADNATKGK